MSGESIDWDVVDLIIMIFSFLHAKKTTFSFHYVFFLLNMNECVKLYNISAPVSSGRIHTHFLLKIFHLILFHDASISVAKLFHPLSSGAQMEK